MAEVLITSNVCLTMFSKSWNVVMICFIDGGMGCASGSCRDNHEGVYCPSTFFNVVYKWLVSMDFVVSCFLGNLSLVYVYSMNCTVRLSVGDGGGLF